MYLYNKRKISELLNTVQALKDIITDDTDDSFSCPYDKLIICSEELPSQEFLDIIKPAMYQTEDDETHYRYRLVYELFSVQWKQVNPKAATTSIMLNPWKHRLTPAAVLKIIDFIIGSHHFAYVVKSDDKVDYLHTITSKELSKCLFVGYQKKPPTNYMMLDQTFLYGKSKGQQVKNYDKAEEQGISEITWTRVEKTRKIRDKNARPTIFQFLFDDRADALKNMLVVDTERFSGRDKIIRRIKKYGTFQAAYMSLNAQEKRKLRNHEAFKSPKMNLFEAFRTDLDIWLSTSPILRLMKMNLDAVEKSWSNQDISYTTDLKVNPICSEYNQITTSLIGFNKVYSLTRSSHFSEHVIPIY
ncbi:hypothetical protein V3851_11825 [Paenibacillus sp. M1]|uniref:Uncharacterized protein n=1 Tax=Paenibacillus haidiansis TaxID=1574488 RepID=A0ABU7VRW9_9BACL